MLLPFLALYYLLKSYHQLYCGQTKEFFDVETVSEGLISAFG
jgi:hypothetical protein